MSAKDALLFIDANKYLDLYRTDKGKNLLAPLTEQADYIFITQQVVDEVYRNKVSVAADFLKAKSQGMKLYGLNVPDHLSGSADGKNKEILDKMKDISSEVSSVNSEIDAHTNEIMVQISQSKDEVSIALESIFSNKIAATTEELKRARKRKEIGNPPGKKSNPLGDEISWEQILSNFKGKKRLWIISRDGDYGTRFGGDLFLNGFLKFELTQVSDEPEVYIFEDLVEGLKHFVETTNVEANAILTDEELDEIEAEERALPPLYSSLYSQQTMQAWRELHRTLSGSLELQRAMSASQEIQKALSGSLELQRAMSESREIQKALSGSLELQRAMSMPQEARSVFNPAQPLGEKIPGDEDE